MTLFNTARLKLTGWYLLIIMAISLTFSFIIYEVLNNELERIERTHRVTVERMVRLVPLANPELIAETQRRILVTLGLVNLAILVASGGLGFILAGQTLAPIKEMVDEQNQFISDASHELRTPLTSLRTAMEVYLRDRKPTLIAAKALIGESIDEVVKLQTLSDSLLQLARFRAPVDTSQPEKLKVGDLIAQAVRKVKPIASQKKITINPEPGEYAVLGHREQLINLIVILLDNAIKYSPRHTTIDLTTKRATGMVTLTVADHGSGIAKADLPHIFDRFYRSDSARQKSGSGGYGLGLAIARKIVELHGGTITAKSQVDHGSAFMVKLPSVRQKIF